MQVRTASSLMVAVALLALATPVAPCSSAGPRPNFDGFIAPEGGVSLILHLWEEPGRYVWQVYDPTGGLRRERVIELGSESARLTPHSLAADGSLWATVVGMYGADRECETLARFDSAGVLVEEACVPSREWEIVGSRVLLRRPGIEGINLCEPLDPNCEAVVHLPWPEGFQAGTPVQLAFAPDGASVLAWASNGRLHVARYDRRGRPLHGSRHQLDGPLRRATGPTGVPAEGDLRLQATGHLVQRSARRIGADCSPQRDAVVSVIGPSGLLVAQAPAEGIDARVLDGVLLVLLRNGTLMRFTSLVAGETIFEADADRWTRRQQRAAQAKKLLERDRPQRPQVASTTAREASRDSFSGGDGTESTGGLGPPITVREWWLEENWPARGVELLGAAVRLAQQEGELPSDSSERAFVDERWDRLIAAMLASPQASDYLRRFYPRYPLLEIVERVTVDHLRAGVSPDIDAVRPHAWLIGKVGIWPEVEPALRQLLDEEDLEAAKALAWVGDPSALDLLLDVGLMSPKFGDRWSIVPAEVLRRAGDALRPALEPYLDAGRRVARRNARALLRRIGPTPDDVERIAKEAMSALTGGDLLDVPTLLTALDGGVPVFESWLPLAASEEKLWSGALLLGGFRDSAAFFLALRSFVRSTDDDELRRAAQKVASRIGRAL